MSERALHTFRRAGLLALAILTGIGAWAVAGQDSAPPGFDHALHAPLFPGGCLTCHAGVSQAGAALWPAIESCANCHDGEVEARVEWQPPTRPPASNLRFAHDRHATATRDSVSCGECHAPAEPARAVQRTVVDQCIACHQPNTEHLAVADQQCATCHLTLAQATGLTMSDVAGFPVPPTHAVDGFSLGGHGEGASVPMAGGGTTVAASCATCHAQNFCINCHVNAPEVPSIQALASDERSLVHRANFMAPPSHAEINFLASHGPDARKNQPTCAACHSQPSCLACHVAPAPKQAMALAQPGPGRAVGARTTRHPPLSHTAEFKEGHAGEANATPRTCSTCHVREDCLSCHRPGARESSAGGDYHPTGFLARHPAATYARQTACGDCHNAQQFCASCHQQAGLNARAPLGRRSFHDGKAAFIVGHGQAARQSLESCVSCHVERDCMACHAAAGAGFGFNPHGPGFDGERLRKRNPEMCIACHGTGIPGLGRIGR